MSYKIEPEEIKGESIPIYYFDNPMMHEDWHEAEKLGLSYVRYLHHGPDYWDDQLMFAPADKKEIVQKHEEESCWW